ncbi:MAG TPA: enoyl-CoA hydratase [Caulobacteraceae bacterium]|nr:enoyl-CoA hydratase [Caulobacteraceae bacterium]
MSFETLLVDTVDAVRRIRLNRPEALNALNDTLMNELTAALDEAEKDPTVRAVIITGSERAFAAGADIKSMAPKSYAEVFTEDFITRNWERAARCRKPLIAAVAGYALGGGCELAMMCDIVIAAETAKFGQPEITLGVSPGAGGTQRLPRAVGKAKAMDLVLTGRMMDAVEAERAGLVSRIVPADKLQDEALAVATTIAAMSPNAVMMAKEMVDAAYETPLAEGVKLERRLFHSLFAFADQKEGMAAFIEKRKPKFTGR